MPNAAFTLLAMITSGDKNSQLSVARTDQTQFLRLFSRAGHSINLASQIHVVRELGLAEVSFTAESEDHREFALITPQILESGLLQICWTVSQRRDEYQM